ncbi:hypothetical protein X975_26895, partial [Stegodyphus mimosarum]
MLPYFFIPYHSLKKLLPQENKSTTYLSNITICFHQKFFFTIHTLYWTKRLLSRWNRTTFHMFMAFL